MLGQPKSAGDDILLYRDIFFAAVTDSETSIKPNWYELVKDCARNTVTSFSITDLRRLLELIEQQDNCQVAKFFTRLGLSIDFHVRHDGWSYPWDRSDFVMPEQGQPDDVYKVFSKNKNQGWELLELLKRKKRREIKELSAKKNKPGENKSLIDDRIKKLRKELELGKAYRSEWESDRKIFKGSANTIDCSSPIQRRFGKRPPCPLMTSFLLIGTVHQRQALSGEKQALLSEVFLLLEGYCRSQEITRIPQLHDACDPTHSRMKFDRLEQLLNDYRTDELLRSIRNIVIHSTSFETNQYVNNFEIEFSKIEDSRKNILTFLEKNLTKESFAISRFHPNDRCIALLQKVEHFLPAPSNSEVQKIIAASKTTLRAAISNIAANTILLPNLEFDKVVRTIHGKGPRGVVIGLDNQAATKNQMIFPH